MKGVSPKRPALKIDVTGPEKILFAPFSPEIFTSCDSEGVKHPVDLLYCCSRPDGPLPGPASGGGSGRHQHAAVPLRLQPGPAAPAHGAAGGRTGQHQDGGAERAVQGLFAHHHELLARHGGSGQGGATGSRGTETGGWMLGFLRGGGGGGGGCWWIGGLGVSGWWWGGGNCTGCGSEGVKHHVDLLTVGGVSGWWWGGGNCTGCGSEGVKHHVDLLTVGG